MKRDWPESCPVFTDDSGAIVIATGMSNGQIEVAYPACVDDTGFQSCQPIGLSLFGDLPWQYKPRNAFAAEMLAIARGTR